MRSQVNPMRSSTPGAKFSTSTSQLFTSRSSTSLPLWFLVSSVIERLLWLSMVKYRLSAFGTSRSWPRVMSPVPGRSTLITSAPNQASSWVQVGPACTWLRSRMRTPSSALPAAPPGFVGGRGRPLADAAAFFGASFTTFLADFFAAPLVLDLLFLRVAIVVPLDERSIDSADLFLANHALRVEVADAAALGAGRRVDHRVDKGRQPQPAKRG